MTEPLFPMQLIRGIYNIRPQHRGCVATIGNYDGIHCGHCSILKRLVQYARRLQCRSCVITFEPLPGEYFLGASAPARLTSLREKLLFLQQAGIDQVLCLPFGAKLQQQTPDAFVRTVLVDGLHVRHLLVGDDFHYGLNREGNMAHLERVAPLHGFTVEDTVTVQMERERISSTRIRQSLAHFDLRSAERMLGRPFTMIGRVVDGRKLGRQLGFPTANIRVKWHRLPLQGVFVVRVRFDGQARPGVANLGVRPSVGADEPLLEVHLLNWQQDLYGKLLQVEFVERIRGEQRFDSLDDLKAAIRRDVQTAEQLTADQNACSTMMECDHDRL